MQSNIKRFSLFIKIKMFQYITLYYKHLILKYRVQHLTYYDSNVYKTIGIRVSDII